MKEEFSLIKIVDRLNDIEQHGELLTISQKEEAKNFLARFFIDNPIYLGFHIPTLDFVQGGQLYTGERIHTRMGIHTVLSLEICRALLSLLGYQPDLEHIMNQVDSRLENKCYVRDYCITGECVYAALTFWRYLLVSDWSDREQRLKNYLRILRENRDGYGGWKHFPFYYTLFVLQETQLPEAREELSYALPACHSHLPNLVIGEPFRSRRKMVLDYCISNMQNEPSPTLPLGI
jgi:hypothetical protein